MPRGGLHLDERSSGRIRALLSTVIGWYPFLFLRRSLEVSAFRDLVKFPFNRNPTFTLGFKNYRLLQRLGLFYLNIKSQKIFSLMRQFVQSPMVFVQTRTTH
jgi:hypothetical protein